MKKWIIAGLSIVLSLGVRAETGSRNLDVRSGFIYNHGAVNPGDMGMTFTNTGIRDITVSAGQLSGVDPETGAVITNSANLLSLKAESLTTASDVTAGGTFVGDGSGLTNLNVNSFVGTMNASSLPTSGSWNASGLTIQNPTLSGDLHVDGYTLSVISNAAGYTLSITPDLPVKATLSTDNLKLSLVTAAEAVQEPLRIVATGGRMGHDFYGPISSAVEFRHRTPHVLGGPVDEIQIGFMNWSHSYTAEVVSTNDITIEYAWLERESTGQIVPLTFGGTRQFVMPANSLDAYFPADVIDSLVWIGSSLVQDEVFWVHIKGSMPVGSVVYTGTPATWSGAKFITYDPANDPGTYDTTGPVPAISGSKSYYKGIPLVFAGRYSESGHLSVIGVGDSIFQGTGDTENPVQAISGFGFFNRAALDENGSHAIAMFNLTRHGLGSSAWNNPVRMPQFLPLANVVVEELGTNDIGQNGTGDTDALKIRLAGIWTRARNAGVQYVLRTKLLPRTTDATYTWASKAVQTPCPGWDDGGKRDIMNDFFDTSTSSGALDGVINILDAASDPTDTHYWKSNGITKYFTGDGTHVSTTGNAILAPVFRAELLALTGDSGGSGGASEVIIDNTDATGITKVGTWTASTATAGYYGSNYLHDGNTGKGFKSAAFTPTFSAAGDYEVFIRWTSGSNRATNVPVTIVHSDGSAEASLDQTANGGEWYSVGIYSFGVAGTSVTLSNTGTTGYVIVDAVKFTPAIVASEVIIDNTNSTAEVALNGSWAASTSTSGYYGSNYLHDGNTGKGSKSVVFTPTFSSAGDYEVFVRWTSAANRATNVPVTIVHSGGSAGVTLDQTVNGGIWYSVGTYSFGTTGASVTLFNTGTSGYVIADAVKFTPATAGGGDLPTGWSNADIGSVGVPGSSTFNGGIYTVNGSGATIGGTVDSFQFASTVVTGDCTITARVITQSSTSPYARAGVMIRGALTANSMMADAIITPSSGAYMQSRLTDGETVASGSGGAAAAPYWVRVTRVGNVCTGYKSVDGSTWVQMSTPKTIAMSSATQVGLAVCSYANNTLGTATFDNVTISP